MIGVDLDSGKGLKIPSLKKKFWDPPGSPFPKVRSMTSTEITKPIGFLFFQFILPRFSRLDLSSTFKRFPIFFR